MIEYARSKLGFLAACPLKKTIVNNERVYTAVVRQRLDGRGNPLGQYCRESQPVRFGTVQEPVESVFGKRLFEGSCLLLHVQAPIPKDVAEFVLEDIKNRNSFFFLSVAGTKMISDFVFAEERENRVKKFLSILIQ